MLNSAMARHIIARNEKVGRIGKTKDSLVPIRQDMSSKEVEYKVNGQWKPIEGKVKTAYENEQMKYDRAEGGYHYYTCEVKDSKTKDKKVNDEDSIIVSPETGGYDISVFIKNKKVKTAWKSNKTLALQTARDLADFYRDDNGQSLNIVTKDAKTKDETLWEYEDGAGVKRQGYVEKFADHGGTDVTYFFRRKDGGNLDVVSGSRLKNAKVISKDSKDVMKQKDGLTSEDKRQIQESIRRLESKRKEAIKAGKENYLNSEIARLKKALEEPTDFFMRDISDSKTKDKSPRWRIKDDKMFKLKTAAKKMKDAVNHMGERSFRTYEAWKRACKEINPNVQFEGDKDICQAKPGIGEWDGNEGIIYTKDIKKTKDVAGYVVSRIGKYQVIEGIGPDGGYFFAVGRGETKRFKTRKEAEEHAYVSQDSTATDSKSKDAKVKDDNIKEIGEYKGHTLKFNATQSQYFVGLKGGVGHIYGNDVSDLKRKIDKWNREHNSTDANTELTIGKHDDVPDSKFDKDELAKGIKVEMEHTNDPEVAKSIAKDHLSEIRDYYTRLLKLEAEAKTKDGGPGSGIKGHTTAEKPTEKKLA